MSRTTKKPRVKTDRAIKELARVEFKPWKGRDVEQPFTPEIMAQFIAPLNVALMTMRQSKEGLASRMKADPATAMRIIDILEHGERDIEELAKMFKAAIARTMAAAATIVEAKPQQAA